MKIDQNIINIFFSIIYLIFVRNIVFPILLLREKPALCIEVFGVLVLSAGFTAEHGKATSATAKLASSSHILEKILLKIQNKIIYLPFVFKNYSQCFRIRILITD